VRNVQDSFGNGLQQQTIAVTEAPPDPTLNITQTGTALKITWRVVNYLSDPFELEFSSNIARPDLWYRAGSVTVEGDLRTFTGETTNRTGFFRLRRLE
jgi:hypothetical protein